MRNRTVGINIRVTVTEKKKVTMLARKCGLSLSEYLRQRALGYEPGGHPPKEVFDVLDKIDEMAESCSVRDGAAINAQTDRMRDQLIGGNSAKRTELQRGQLSASKRTRESNRIDRENQEHHTNHNRRRIRSRQR